MVKSKTGERLEFIVPEKKPPKYNEWKFGRENMISSYLKKNFNTKKYIDSTVYYLLGAQDNAQDKPASTDKQKAVLLQGNSRLERAKFYLSHLNKFGSPKAHLLIELPNITNRLKSMFGADRVRLLLMS